MIDYQIKASSITNQEAVVKIKQSYTNFGITAETAKTLPNPAELFLSSFAACILKNVERFSVMMKFTYTKATLTVNATRLEKPPKMDNIIYNLIICSNDKKLNLKLLKKNIEQYGTIYNTVKLICAVSGTINILKNV
ncbi:OsmC family protein [Wenyingzhuangia sp. 2_MG-2023]|uniref:OsmC family protein n=1 Tax=Wenyingzhuangia sp. 2_MG-2023 TaxID=3062639 RepID=UPI0026E1166A|nr:OsmC family protein [Wenyingzhuangia sp. 2_MG-2023]MDO6738656.1 OsmC family protein [Wenyingzhuangia sp. 2_MG-2023]